MYQRRDLHMKSLMIAMILSLLFAIFVGSIVFWGLGALIVYVFNIDYNWTILHGFCCELLYILLKQLLTRDK